MRKFFMRYAPIPPTAFVGVISVFESPSWVIHTLFVWVCIAICAFIIHLGQRTRALERETERAKWMISQMPVNVQPLGHDEAHRNFSVTKQSGEVVMISLPLEYHPEQDHGSQLLRAVLGDELYDEMHGDFMPAASFSIGMDPPENDDA